MDSLRKLYYMLLIFYCVYGVLRAQNISLNSAFSNNFLIKSKPLFLPSLRSYNRYYWKQNQLVHDKLIEPLQIDFEITPSTNNKNYESSMINGRTRNEWLCKTNKICNIKHIFSKRLNKIVSKKSTEKLTNPFIENTQSKFFDLNDIMQKFTLPKVQGNPNVFKINFTVGEDWYRQKRSAESEEMDPFADTRKVRPLKLLSKFKFPRTAHLNFHPQVINMHKHQLHTSNKMDNEDRQDSVILPSSFKETFEPLQDKITTTTVETPQVKIITRPVIAQQYVQQPFLLPVIDDIVQYPMGYH